jgi:D-methionine transport system permease protein
MSWDDLEPMLKDATDQTLQMVFWSALFAAVGGLLLGVLLVVTERGGLLPIALANKVIGLVVNVGRSLPFMILLIAILPFTRMLVGTTIGTTSAIVPLTIAAIPFYARLVETSLREVDPGVIAAAQAMGASRLEIIRKVLLREARPGLIAGLTVTVIALISYSAMAGAIGAGGLGDLALEYGYQRFDTGVMVATVVVLIVLVQLIQMAGDVVVRRLTHR